LKNNLVQDRRWIYALIALAVFANLSGLFVTIMAPDAVIYAGISKTMALINNYLELFWDGKDWLDKPHFPFWVTAIFFEVFGIHTWTYKLPGILFTLMGAWYTYRLAKHLYNETVALCSSFILLTALHIVVSNNDVRAEPFLTGLIIASVYHFVIYSENKKLTQLLLACLFSACAIMTKGPFTMIPIAGALGGHFIIRREWKKVFQWQWLLAIVLILIFIIPELYSLWYQFDDHPEKIVFERTGVSGLSFFFWDSQFGRFLNTGPIKGKGDPSFFIHTLLWAFLPWAILMYAALVRKIADIRKRETIIQGEWFTLSGSLLTLIVFSLSRFQLPHYANIIFPFLAILTAQWIFRQTPSNRFITITQEVHSILIGLIGIALHILFKPEASFWPDSILFITIILSVWILFKLKSGRAIYAFYRSGIVAILLYVYINLFFYPDLLRYQSGSEAAFYLNKTYPDKPIMSIAWHPGGIEFYLNNQLTKVDSSFFKTGQDTDSSQLWFLSSDQLNLITRSGYSYEIVKEWDHFHVTRLTLKFANKNRRKEELSKYFLLRIRRN